MRTSLPLVLLAALASLAWPMAPVAGAPLYTITVQVDPRRGHGDARSPKTGYAKNNIVTVAAAPAPGKVFTGWGGAPSGTQNPTTLRVSSNHTVIGEFRD